MVERMVLAPLSQFELPSSNHSMARTIESCGGGARLVVNFVGGMISKLNLNG